MSKELTEKKRGLDGRLIVKEGEQTGHMHAIIEKDGVKCFQDNTGEVVKMTITAPVTIVHEEHAKQVIEEKGDYIVGTVNEFDPFAEAAKKVQD